MLYTVKPRAIRRDFMRCARPDVRMGHCARRRVSERNRRTAAALSAEIDPSLHYYPEKGFLINRIYRVGFAPPGRKPKKGMRSSFKMFRQGRNSEFIIYYLLSFIYNQYITLPHFSAPYISPSFWVKIGQFFSVSPVAICLRCPYNRDITARALRMCFRSALFH